MASKAFLVALQYGMLLCICGYIFVTVKSMFKDLKSTSSLKPVKEESAQNEVALISPGAYAIINFSGDFCEVYLKDGKLQVRTDR